MPLRVLSWNLMHGRAVPPARRDLLEEFAGALGGWQWDVALLQEVPPWWPAELGARLHAHHRRVLTSRNALLALRRAIAVRWPDVIKSNGGGCNAILVRRGTITDHRVRRLCRLPERRWVHAVRLLGVDSERPVWIANLHATVHDDAAAVRDAHNAAAAALAWAGGEPLVLGGDFNVRGLSLEGFVRVAAFDVDYVFTSGLAADGEAEVLDRGRLSDHAPIAVRLTG